MTVKDNPLGLMTRMNFTKAVLLSAVFSNGGNGRIITGE